MWVAKFGGSSVKNAWGIKRCARLALAQPKTGLVILSATWNTTNLLEQASRAPIIFEQIKQKHDQILKELGLSQDVVADIYRETESLTKGQKAAWCALGERLSSKIFATYLKTITDRPHLLGRCSGAHYYR